MKTSNRIVVVITLLITLASAAAEAATMLRITADPDEPFTRGTSVSVTSAQARFDVSNACCNASAVRVTIPDPTRPGYAYWYWSLSFSAPGTLAPGHYDNAGDFSPVTPALRVGPDYGYCQKTTGRFSVHEIVRDSLGTVKRLAIDFVQRCDGAPAQLRGVLRINSDVPTDAGVFAVAGPKTSAREGETISLDGSRSYSLGDDIVSFAWRQISGPSVDLVTGPGAGAQFVAPEVSPGGADLLFELEVKDSSGRTSLDTIAIHVFDDADRRTLLYVEPSLDGLVPRVLTDLDGTFSAHADSGVASLSYDGSGHWSLDARVPGLSGPLAAGTYLDTTPSDVVAPGSGTQIYASIGGRPYCWGATGTLDVLDAQYEGTRVVSFAGDWAVFCAEQPPYFGSIRIDSSVPIGPRAPVLNVAAPSRVAPDQQVVLDASKSFDPQHGSLAFSWQQTSGPGVTLTGSGTAQAAFAAPSVGATGVDLTFNLTATNAAGSTSRIVAVRVVGAEDPRSVLVVRSVDGDPAGLGTVQSISEWDSKFSGYLEGYLVRFAVGDWNLQFQGTTSPPTNGEYVDDDDTWPYALNVSKVGGTCLGGPKGRVTVLEAVYDAFSQIQRFAADFDQRCGRGAMFGSIRFQSAVPIGSRPPSIRATFPAEVAPEGTLELDASATLDPQNSPLTYEWTQLSGPSLPILGASSPTARVHFSGAYTGAFDLAYQLRVTNALGLSDTLQAHVHVRVQQPSTDSTVVLHIVPSTWYLQGGMMTFDASKAQGYVTSSNSVAVVLAVSPGYWSFTFGAGSGRPLVPGVYANVAEYPSDAPMLSMAGMGNNSCYYNDRRWFRIYEIEQGSTGRPRKFAADFIVECRGIPNALFGSIRINSTIPVASKPTTTVPIAPASGTGQLSLAVSGNVGACTLAYARALPAPPGTGDVPPTAPGPGVQFPYGMVVFQTDNCTPGSTLVMSLTLPDAPPPGIVYWKYGPTPGHASPHWYAVPSTVTGNVVRFTIVDGGLGDDDLVANGVVIDAGGVGVLADVPIVDEGPSPPPVAVVNNAPATIPTLDSSSLVATALGLIALAGIALRRRRENGQVESAPQSPWAKLTVHVHDST